MKSTIKVGTSGSKSREVEVFTFSGGEVSVTLPYIPMSSKSNVTVQAKIQCSDGLIALLMTKEALDAVTWGSTKVYLHLGYVPYARQDRRCNEGEALAIRVLASLINSMNFDCVTILDPHSDVVGALINNVEIIEQRMLLSRANRLCTQLQKGNLTLVAPDAGATKKALDIAKHFNGVEVIQATKERDTKTGRLTHFNYYGDVSGKDLLIVDDIFDGGGTFAGLAAKLKEGGAKSITLFVTHGIFAKGLKIIDGLIDTVYTMDTLNREEGFEEGYSGSYYVLKW